MDPIDTYLYPEAAARFEKAANFAQQAFPFMGAVRRGDFAASAVRGAAGALGAAGAVGGVTLAGKVYGALTKRRDFRGMLDANPDLGDVQAADPKAFNLRYDSLRSLAPQYAKDPLVAGHYMRVMNVTQPGPVLLQASEMQNKSPQSNYKIDLGAKGVGLSFQGPR